MRWGLLTAAALGLVAGTAGIAKADLFIGYTGTATGVGPWFVSLPGYDTSLFTDPVLTDVRYSFDFSADTYLQANVSNFVQTPQETTITLTWHYTVTALSHVLASGTFPSRTFDVTVFPGLQGYQSAIPGAGRVSSGPLGVDLGPATEFINSNGSVNIRGFFDVTSSNPNIHAFNGDDGVVGPASVVYSYDIAPEPSTMVPALTGALLVAGYLWRASVRVRSTPPPRPGTPG